MALPIFRPRQGAAVPNPTGAVAAARPAPVEFVPAGAPTAAPTGTASAQDAALTLALVNRGGRASESELRDALPGGQLRLSYQIQRDVGTGTVVALEALIRWAHPERGLLTPAEFLPMAQASGLMDRIEVWAVQRVCRDGAWLLSRGCAVDIALNVTAEQLIRPGLVRGLGDEVSKAGLPADMLTLELPAIEALDHMTPLREVSLALKARGVRLSLSDVAPGRTSPHRLRSLQPGEFKLDRSFTATLDSADAEDAVEELRNIVAAARHMGARVVAEGIETEHQYETVAAAYCHRAQGFLLGRPAPLEEIAHLVTAPV